MKNAIILFSAISFLLIFVMTSVAATETGVSMDEQDKVSAEKLFKERIFFGHQSVGENILQGLSLVDCERTIKVVDLKVFVGGYQGKPGFYHMKVGENGSPESKVAEFGKIIETYFNGDLDIVFLKLCFGDVTRDTDIAELFSYYRSSLKRLKEKFPDVVFVHFTVPLTISNTTWKTQLKKVLGVDDIWEYTDNIKRNQYNQMLLEEYKGKEPIFDIASLEATHSDGSKEVFGYKGKDYYAMAKENSSDGGHLNDRGSRRIALGLLDFLANL